jgi:hypothetical protein
METVFAGETFDMRAKDFLELGQLEGTPADDPYCYGGLIAGDEHIPADYIM